MKLPKHIKRYAEPYDPWQLSAILDKNLYILKKLFVNSDDVVFRDFIIDGQEDARKGVIVYIEGLVNSDVINRDILEKIIYHKDDYANKDGEQSAQQTTNGNRPLDGQKWMKTLIECTLSANNLSVCQTITEVKDGILNAQAVILIDGVNAGIVAGVEGYEVRGISEPESSVVIRGPREGFNENLRTNTSLIRRKIRNHNLKGETMLVGEKTHTKICLMYLDGVVNQGVLQELKKRINDIKIDAILESGYIEEMIEDNPFSPFPSVSVTERPDDAAAAIMEGRIIIIVDNTPFALNVPMVFEDLMHASEDYYNRYIGGTIVRLIRFFSLFISIFLPSLYVAIVTFHPEMLPTPLLISVAAAREGVPFPALIEAFLMEFTFEALKEAGARMPKAIGSTVSIVGGLILGEAAVSAGLVSRPMVIIVAGTAIASFAIPGFGVQSTVRFIRFPFMALSGMFGLYGIILGAIVLLIHMCSLRSFGVPYMAPFAPIIKEGLKDSLVRAPWWSIKFRPSIFTGKIQRRNRTRRPMAPVILLCLICGMLMTGCWDMKEIEDRAIVSGIGMDLLEDDENGNRIELTVQIVRPGAVAGEGAGSGDFSKSVWVLSAKGRTVQEASIKLIPYAGRSLYWSHAQVIVIGETLARECVGNIVDILDRSPDNRLRTWFMVAKGQTAKELMSAQTNLESILAVELAAMSEVRSETSLAAAINLKDFLYFLSIESRAPVASVVESYTATDGTDSVFVRGSAVFDGTQLQNFYDAHTTRGILWVVHDVRSGVISVDWGDNPGAISTTTFKNKVKVNTKIIDGNLHVFVNVKNDCRLSEINVKLDLRKKEVIEEIERLVSEQIKKEITMAFTKAQEDQLDVFGIGEIVRRQHPQYWKSIEQNWKEVFSQLVYTIEVESELRRFGFTYNSRVAY